jgi:hypothetical protein
MLLTAAAVATETSAFDGAAFFAALLLGIADKVRSVEKLFPEIAGSRSSVAGQRRGLSGRLFFVSEALAARSSGACQAQVFFFFVVILVFFFFGVRTSRTRTRRHG